MGPVDTLNSNHMANYQRNMCSCFSYVGEDVQKKKVVEDEKWKQNH